LFLLASCSLPPKFQVFNNTTSELTITINGVDTTKQFVIAANSSITIDDWAEFGDINLEIKSVEFSWSYKSAYISHGFGEGFYFSHWLFKLQIEPSGKIFVINPKLELPQVQHVKQPKGYPLRPISKNV